MRIKKIDIKDFKGIDNLHFSPKMINIVLGRNCTGKSTLLEAIYLDFDSEDLGKYYQDHFSSLMNVYSKSKCSRIEITSNENKQALKIRKAEPEKLEALFDKRVNEVIQKCSKIAKGKKSNIVLKYIEEFILKNKTRLLTDLEQESILVISDGGERIYFSMDDDKIEEFKKETNSFIYKKLNKNSTKSKKTDYIESLIVLYSIFEKISFPEKGNEKNKLILFLEKLSVKPKKIKRSDSIIMQKIGDIIKEYGILTNLKTFSFDFLIFEERFLKSYKTAVFSPEKLKS